MSISAIGSAPVAQTMPERMEGSGPDNDGDSDDKATQVQSQTKAATATGIGQLLDTVA